MLSPRSAPQLLGLFAPDAVWTNPVGRRLTGLELRRLGGATTRQATAEQLRTGSDRGEWRPQIVAGRRQEGAVLDE